jgi:hypothetical protein
LHIRALTSGLIPAIGSTDCQDNRATGHLPACQRLCQLLCGPLLTALIQEHQPIVALETIQETLSMLGLGLSAFTPRGWDFFEKNAALAPKSWQVGVTPCLNPRRHLLTNGQNA